MTLKLPKLPSLNEYISKERTNRFAAAKLKKTFTELVYYSCLEQKVGRLPRINNITFTWFQKKRFSTDFDNVVFAQKFILDGMVLAKVIPDDSPKFMPTTQVHKHEIAAEAGVLVEFD